MYRDRCICLNGLDKILISVSSLLTMVAVGLGLCVADQSRKIDNLSTELEYVDLESRVRQNGGKFSAQIMRDVREHVNTIKNDGCWL